MITIKSFEFNYFQENTFLLYDDTREAVLIDCGCCRKEEEKELTDFILENKLTLKHLLCTHLHVDHVFGNGFIYKTYGLKPEANKQDVEKLPSPDEQAKLFGLRQQVENVPVEKYIVGGETIKFGTSELQVLTVPGHSPGSLVYYCKEDNCMFSGDVLFQGSIGRADLTGGNFDELIEHICSRLFVLPNETVVYPGHGAPTTIGMEKAENPFFR